MALPSWPRNCWQGWIRRLRHRSVLINRIHRPTPPSMPVNTAALKTFAPAMRRQLIEAVGRKLDRLLHQASADTLTTAAGPIEELRQQEAHNRQELLERVAYSWFNRLAALRYLDARGWHPFGARVLMPQTESETQPEVLKLLRSGSLPAELQPHTDEARLQGLLDGRLPTAQAGADPQGEVYRELILAVCWCSWRPWGWSCR